MWNYFKALFLQVFQGFCMCGKRLTLCPLDVKYPDVQFTGGGDFGIQLPQGTCRRISGIGKEGFPLQLPSGIELFKAHFRHKDFASNNKRWQSLRQTQRDGGDGFEVFRHVLPYLPVASGSAPDKQAVFVFQSHGKPVHFGLHIILHAA